MTVIPDEGHRLSASCRPGRTDGSDAPISVAGAIEGA